MTEVDLLTHALVETRIHFPFLEHALSTLLADNEITHQCECGKRSELGLRLEAVEGM